MKLYCITSCAFINDLSGYGAALNGGRWNSKGVFLLYTSQNISLAQLETLKHYELSRRFISNNCLIVLNVPASSVLPIKAADLPPGWRSDPAPKYLQQIGDLFYRQNKYLILKVPSAINPAEYNYLINPMHKGFGKIISISTQTIAIDRRLLRKQGKKQPQKP